ncbi:LytTR family transcriptional regulator DNA-binding domain-containing protein [Flavivirga amylovorans]|uniref:LytTR family transcriptional regulator DNA-binding domain-containing protein n=1 Tax=Flavivirga amylovorans TaxID=870486 RepID=A0ABT8X4A1_9FLAO|nr:LytTR family transcriptional regulator DNA-binding domain-containing protein [Flavivirga amylovorans]MDO5988662.1 LytTR family transcriptional regulator DNA-binding domain-containing protein [Flavivirga amylovorans]
MRISNKKVLIVEDEFSIALDIQTSLEKLGYVVVGIANNYHDAIQYVEDSLPDVVVMDVNISGDKNGIIAAADIYDNHNIPIVFLTANGDDHTFKVALQSRPFGFLLKPFKTKELSFTIQVAIQKHLESNIARTSPSINNKISETLFIKDKSQLISVKINDILWVEAMDNYTQIITKERKILANMFLKEFYEKVPQDKFLRIHRSYMIALDKIDKIENRLIFIEGHKIPISKTYKSQLIERLDIL